LEDECHCWPESIYQVGTVNRRVGGFSGCWKEEPNWKTVLEKTVSRVGEKAKLDNWEENEELSLKRRKDYEMERIAFN
jgi:hypothetical protein